MNICFVGHFTAGGTERAAFFIANSLLKEHNVFVVNTCDRKPFFELNKKVDVFYLPSGNILRRILNLKKYLKDNEIDLVITVEAMTGVFTIPAVAIARCKHIVWEHANFYQKQGSRWIQLIRQLELLIVDAYVVLTKKDEKNFKNNFRIKTLLKQIYNIASKQVDTTYNLNSKTIISAGHLRKIKNFIIIPDIAKIVFKKHPDWQWNIYGDVCGEEYQNIKNKINEYGLQNHIRLVGRCDEMEKEYKKAALYVLTSLQEGLPMVLLEAKSFCIPIISFDIETGPNEIIRDGENGFLIPPYDIEIMSEKICELIENNKLRKSFSEKSKMDLERFDNSNIHEKWRELINECSSNKGVVQR